MMRASKLIEAVYAKFDLYPMENLTKAWHLQQVGKGVQRTVRQMEQHRREFGVAGNCFDLVFWLLSEFERSGIEAYAIGHDLLNRNAHVAVIAKDTAGFRYLCDLGDQWTKPILIDSHSSAFTPDPVDGFFPAAKVRVITEGNLLHIAYYRPNGKTSRQEYRLEPISSELLWRAGYHSQGLLRHPLCEQRVYMPGGVGHWEFSNWTSVLSTDLGKEWEPPEISDKEWAKRINKWTGIDYDLARTALQVYRDRGMLI